MQGVAAVGVLGRLAVYEGVPVALGKNRGCDLPTGVTVDAGRVHEEIAGNVLRHTLLAVSHEETSRHPILPVGKASRSRRR